ncbi:MAG: hypothetical protein AB7O97_09645 [Planctomycetota bacterium]
MAGLAGLGGCALMPSELNLAPLWFHRLDERGELLEMDLLWPVVHYERTTEGGDDFRIRPLYRRVTEPEAQAVEHQFLWPFGRIRTDPVETSHRLWPLWSWRSREDQDGLRDIDWYALFPLLWGGWHERGDENYFAFFPFYADIPQFLTYDRFRTILFPLWVALDKEGHHHSLWLWPLIGISSCAEGGHEWFRVLPFYGHEVEPGQHDRRFALWPLINWAWENLDSTDPVWSLLVWPLFGVKTGRTASGLSVLWPLFEKNVDEGRSYKLNVLWPFFHYYESPREENLVQWWLWPFVGRAHSDDQDSWSFLWPLIWWRRYDDPEVHTEQEWVLPLFWHVRQEFVEGHSEDFVKLWPVAHRTVRRDADGNRTGGDWSVLSPIPWRDGNAVGVEENYGFLWQLAVGRQRAVDDRSVDVLGRLFTRRARKGRTTASVPFLFNYESSASGEVLRLFQFLPIRLSGPPAPAPAGPLATEGGT